MFCKFQTGYNSQWFTKTSKRKENYTHGKYIKEVEESHRGAFGGTQREASTDRGNEDRARMALQVAVD